MPTLARQLPGLIALPALCIALGATALGAQRPASLVTVRVRGDTAPVPDAVVRAGRVGALSDERGEARLRLADGAQQIVVTKIGFRPETLAVVIRGADTVLAVAMTEQAAEMEAVVVTATRGERRIEDEPVRVEVLAGEDVAEKRAMRPGDLRNFLSEMSGVRIQPTAPALGGVGVRIQGLRGQYTQLLSDGLPLYGTQNGGFGLAQIPPLDLRQAEVIKGAATALYGPAALGGVVNLVSRRPERERDLVINQTSRQGTDALGWRSRRVTDRWGYTALAGVHRQSVVDIDEDGWLDIPGYTRAEARPRLFWENGTGNSVFATAGFMGEQRRGGHSDQAVTPDGPPFAERLRTRRGDGGVVGRFALGSAVLGARAAVSAQSRRHQFGDSLARDRHATAFGEVTLAGQSARIGWVGGLAWERDGYRARDLPAFDYTFTTPSAFAQATLAPGARLSATASGRCDAHSRYGTICSPRASALARLGRDWSARLSAGAGFFAPTPFTDETETTGLWRVVPPSGLVAERARMAALDVNGKRGAVEVSGTLFASRIAHPLGLRDVAGDTAGRVELVNAPAPTRTHGVELFAVYHREPIALTAYYAYLRSTELDVDTGERREVPLNPRHSAAIDWAYQTDEGLWLALEAFYTGRQALELDPYRSVSRPYTSVGALAARRFGPAQLFVNGENLLDVRQTRWDPLTLPRAGRGGRLTTDQWAPLEGRLVNAGVRLSF